MKFKEKDLIVSMEQWFPNDVSCRVEGVREVNVDRVIKTMSYVSRMDNKDFTELLHLLPDAGTIVTGGMVKGHVLVGFVNGKKEIVCKDGTIALLFPSDWVLTYQSGKREVLTDKEKQERFE